MAEPAEKLEEESAAESSSPKESSSPASSPSPPQSGDSTSPSFAEFDKELDNLDRDDDIIDEETKPPAAEETPPPPAAEAPDEKAAVEGRELPAGTETAGAKDASEESPETPASPAEPSSESAEGASEQVLKSLPPEAKEGDDATPPEAEPKPSASPEEQKAAYEAAREAAISQLESAYAFSEEDAEALNSEPEKVLPKVAARLHMEVLQNVLQTVQANLPNWVQGVQQATARQAQFSQQFFNQWPDLREHTSEVDRIGQVWRTMNPSAPPEDYIREVGAMAMVRLRKPIPGATSSEAGGASGASSVQPSRSPPALALPASKAPSPPRNAGPDEPINIFEALDKDFEIIEEEDI